ncbi:IPTL-CTERM sorting domain-containing protein [Acidovorax sp. sif1233]|uniref:IPTL-CTERM sorting domain-containing protein n=1 Tax=Acidovorax sp. sif1233 TaxID=2854792 RepID=UPI001C450B38|nr:IPTL-CTERM sorting domain-containing protein [Acidovorax sp. sif1233]MBV7456598.1 IPTL-CTERM sorting domain-containing protein [Acidovorax sp. sif1233]
MPFPSTTARLAGLLLAAAAALPGAAPAQVLYEGFDDTFTLSGNGWVMQNNSAPVGAMGWFQGTPISALPDPGPFDAYSGAANAYIAANFRNTGSSGTISNWLVMPNRTLSNGDVLTFYTRKPVPNPTDYPDRLEVRMSTQGASTDVGTTATDVGDFTTLLTSINPGLAAGGYPAAWTQYRITVSGLAAPTSGRVAFRYFVTGAGTFGANGDYIGIDDVTLCPAPAMTATGTPANGTAGAAYAYTLAQAGAVGGSSFAVAAGALPPGLVLSAAGAISGTPTATGTFSFTATVTDSRHCSASLPTSITVQAGKPPPPASATATAGDAEATVDWSPERWADAYGAPITSYTATAVQDPARSCTVTGSGHSCTVANLANGASYTFRVVAHNGSPTQPDSDAAVTNAVTPLGAQSITFLPATIPAQAAGTTLTLGATATSNLPITYSATGACSVAGSVASFSGAGSCTLTASQPGGGAWAAAAPVARTFAVMAAPTLALAANANPSALGASVTLTATFGSASNPTGTVSFSADGLPLACAAPPAITGSVAACTVSGLLVGAHAITASYAGDANNTSATGGPLALTVGQASLAVPGGGMAQASISGGPAGCTVGSLALTAAAPGDNLPAGATAPLGVLRFTATGCAGATLAVAITYPGGSLAGLVPRKFGPATAGATALWFPHGAVSGDTVSFAVTDNGTGDNDPAPGAIADPHAMLMLAAAAQAIPTLSEWGLLVLAALLGLAALRRFQARSASSA